jgi:uncharacterized membrane protein
MNAASFFTKEQQSEILVAVKEAEKSTSGEIRVHIETECSEDVLDRAAWIFRKLNMHNTAERTGVLFYLAVRDHKFAIIGDTGINAKVPEGFWNEIKDLMETSFRESRFTDGLKEGILLAGSQLKAHFPYLRDDINELPDEISFNKTAGE